MKKNPESLPPKKPRNTEALPVIRFQLPLAMLKQMFPEGSDAEADIAAGTLSNFSDEIVRRVSGRILNQVAGRDLIARIQQEVMSGGQFGTQLSGAWAKQIKDAARVAGEDVIKREATAAVLDREEDIRKIVNTSLEALVTSEIQRSGIRDKVRQKIATAIQEEIDAAQVTVKVQTTTPK